MAGIPILSPDGLNGGFGSSGIVDLEVDIHTKSKIFSAFFPFSISVFEKSIIII
jgi:hypothetical protein